MRRFFSLSLVLVILMSFSFLMADYFIDFEGEGETKTSYASGTVTLSGLDWDLTEVLIGTLEADFKNGERSARLRGYAASSMTMLESKDGGIGVISFLYRRYGTDAQVDWKVEYSLDEGSSWTQIGEVFTAPTSDQVQTFEEIVNVQGNARIRIKRATEEGSNNRRLNIDDILVTNYTGGEPQTARPAFDPSAGTYYSPVSVTITSATDGAEVYYTLDGTEPDQNSQLYEAPVYIYESTTLRARAYAPDHLPSTVNTGNYEMVTPIVVETLAELRQGVADGHTYIFGGDAVLTYQQSFRNQKFIQDDTAAILIDDDAGVITTEYQVGDGISGIIGMVNEFGNMIQFTPLFNSPEPISHNNSIIPVLITMDEMINDFMDYQSQVVKIESVFFPDADGEVVFQNGRVYSITDGADEAEFRTTFFDVDYIDTIIPIDQIDITGILNSRSDGNYITPRNNDDLYSVTNVELPVIGSGLKLRNYPNPFNPNTTLSFTIPADGEVSVSVYNIRGQRVVELFRKNLPAGEHKVDWNGTDARGQVQASGLYLFKLETEQQSLIHRAMLLK